MKFATGLAVCAVASVVAIAAPASAQSTQLDSAAAENDAKVRVNLAGRQRMLSQRMSKAVCLLNQGIEADTQADILNGSRNDFSVVLKALGSKDEELGLVTSERSSRVFRGIAEVEDIWSRFDGAIGTMIENGDFGNAGAEVVFTESEPLLGKMNDLVSTIEQLHANPAEMMAAEGLAINIAGRQRMLTQKMGKELCLVFAGWGGDVTQTTLAKTMKMFEVSHTALEQGNPAVGISAPPTPEIEAALQQLGTDWQALRPVIEAAINGDDLSQDDIARYARDGDALLRNMNAIVGMYEQL